jgi:hypothetical protein
MTAGSSTIEECGVDGECDVESVDAALLRLASAAHCFRSVDGRLHARLPVADRHETFELGSLEFGDWLIESYRAERDDLPPANAVARVVRAVEARARFAGGTPALHVRVGRESESGNSGALAGQEFYLDLGSSSGQAVKISARGWLVVDRPAVNFERAGGLLPLPAPTRGGSIERLRAYVNVSEGDFPLLVGWMAAALLPDGPYPLLAVQGEQGSAKSTLAKVIRQLIDPQASPVLAAPKSTRDLMVTAANGWLIAYDNLSAIPTWLSDGLCLLSTGGGMASRALWSNSTRNVIHAQRPVILNGIDDFVRRDDLADRCVFLHLPPILDASRRAEGEFWRAFHAEAPAILGALLEALAGGLRELPSLQPTELPRMADFACLGEAIGRRLGWQEGAFLRAYIQNRREAAGASLEESAVAAALFRLAQWGTLENWTLSASEMLGELGREAGQRVRASAAWPKSPRVFADELRRLAPLLRTRGISVTFSRTNARRLITIDAAQGFGGDVEDAE